MNDTHDRSRAHLDGIALVLSGTCLLHCLLLPLLVAAMPVFLGLTTIREQTFHLVMLIGILPTSLLALAWGARKHKDFLTILWGGAGLSILAFTALFGHDLFGLAGERIVTSLGGVILAAAHIRNFLICRRLDCRHGIDH